MTYSIRTFGNEEEGTRGALLVDDQGYPFFYPNVFITTLRLPQECQYATVLKELRTIGMVYDWAKTRSPHVDVEEAFLKGDLLLIEQAEDLAYFLRLNRPSQRKRVAERTSPASGRNVTLLGPRKASSALQEECVSPHEAATRCRTVASFLKFLWERRLGTLPLKSDARRAIEEHGQLILGRIKDLAPTTPDRADDESKEGISKAEEDLLLDALDPDSPNNPFSTPYYRNRNYLMFRMLREPGIRRNELRNIRVTDVDYAALRVKIRISKTEPRTVAISETTSEAFHSFVMDHLRKIPRTARAGNYLFTTASGAQLSRDAINLVFQTFREGITGAPPDITPHTLRRTWNDRFGEMADALPEHERLIEQEEIAVRNRLQGWATNSEMAARYAKRHIREKSDRLAEQLASEVGRRK